MPVFNAIYLKKSIKMREKRRIKPVRWVPSLYFAMGLPFVILNMVVVLMFRGLGVGDGKIAFWTSLIMMPWTLKPLWSPFLEMYKTKKYFVILTQLTSGIIFGLVALSLNLSDFFAIAIALLGVIAICGATHDIAADGVYMSELNESEQAEYIGWQGAFYNLAKVIATGGLVYMAGVMKDHFGVLTTWMIIMGTCGVLLFCLGLYNLKVIPSKPAVKKTKNTHEAFQELSGVISSFFMKKNIFIYIVFIILYRMAEGFVIKIVPLFLAAPIADQGLGLSEQQIGLYYGTFGACAFILGSFLSGYYIAKKGLRKTLFSLCLIFNIPFVAYTFLAIYQPTSGGLIAAAIVSEYFGYGFGFVGLTLFMMQQVAAGKHQMAHYAFATGIMNLGVMLPGMVSGYLCEWLGYQNFFIYTLFAAIPAFFMAYFIPFRNDNTEKETFGRELEMEMEANR